MIHAKSLINFQQHQKKKKFVIVWALNTNIMYVWMCVLSIYYVYYLILENNALLSIVLLFFSMWVVKNNKIKTTFQDNA